MRWFSWAFVLLCARAAANSVTVLSKLSFDAEVKGAPTATLVEFFAPWCGHCKKLAPKLETAAQAVGTGPSALAKFASVDCEAHPTLCEAFAVSGFPTLLFWNAGSGGTAKEAWEYRGPRSAEALTAFGRRMAGPAVSPLPTRSVGGKAFDLQDWAAQDGPGSVSFMYVSPSASTAVDSGLESAFNEVAAVLRSWQRFGSVTEAEARRLEGLSKHLYPTPGSGPSAPYIARVEAGSEYVHVLPAAAFESVCAPWVAWVRGSGGKGKAGTRSDPLAGFKDGTPASALAAWVLHWRFPLVEALTPESFPVLVSNPEGRFLAIAVLDEKDAMHADNNASRPNAAFLRAMRRLSSPSTSTLAPPVRDRFLFGYLDAAKFAGFIEQFGLAAGDAPRLLVVDATRKAFWYDASVDEEDEMDTWLTDIDAARAPMQRQGILAMPQRFVNALDAVLPGMGMAAAVVMSALVIAAVCYVFYALVVAEAMGWNEEQRAKAAVDKEAVRVARRAAGTRQDPAVEELSADVKAAKAGESGLRQRTQAVSPRDSPARTAGKGSPRTSPRAQGSPVPFGFPLNEE